MYNFNRPKGKRKAAGVLCVIIVLAMVITTLVSVTL